MILRAHGAIGSGRGLVMAAAITVFGAGLAVPAWAQSTDQQIEQMEQKLDMDAKPDMGALEFQDDLAKIEQCQSACGPLIETMIKKYKGRENAGGGNAALGASSVTQLAGAIGSAAATLSKAEAETVATMVATDLGPDAATAFKGSYDSTTAPYDPK